MKILYYEKSFNGYSKVSNEIPTRDPKFDQGPVISFHFAKLQICVEINKINGLLKTRYKIS